jgi:hypothetical protein
MNKGQRPQVQEVFFSPIDIHSQVYSKSQTFKVPIDTDSHATINSCHTFVPIPFFGF